MSWLCVCLCASDLLCVSALCGAGAVGMKGTEDVGVRETGVCVCVCVCVRANVCVGWWDGGRTYTHKHTNRQTQRWRKGV